MILTVTIQDQNSHSFVPFVGFSLKFSFCFITWASGSFVGGFFFSPRSFSTSFPYFFSQNLITLKVTLKPESSFPPFRKIIFDE